LDLEALDTIANAFSRLARGEATVPPIIGVEVPERRGEVDVKTAYVRGLDSFAVKIASGFYDNAARGLPTSSGMMVLISAHTGFPEAVLLDNGYLTAVRTACAGAIAAKYLSRGRVDTVGVIGTGLQGRQQVKALALVRQFRRVIAYDQEAVNLRRYVAEMSDLLHVPVIAATDPSEAVVASDVVITSTPARQPYLKAEWLHAGLHITAMGADAPEKQELHPEVMGRADVIVCDLITQCSVRGELHHALEARTVTEVQRIIELGELTSGRKAGRTTDSELTVCDLTGVGVQDTAIALLAFTKAMQKGLGVRFPPDHDRAGGPETGGTVAVM
jgi:ornithine cyclodeaminase